MLNIAFMPAAVLKFAAVFLLATASGFGVGGDETLAAGKPTTEPSDERPNVVLILIDDLSHYGVTAYGANQVKSLKGRFPMSTFGTPNIDALAKSGMRFDRAFTYPICENTRIALMSGKNNERNYLQCKSQHESDITFGDTFRRAGYVTGLFGKWKQTRGTKSVPGKEYISRFGWDEYTAYDVVTEGQRFINPNLVVNGEIKNYQGRKDLDPETGRRWYGPDIVNRDALKFIDRHQDKPFFLYYPMMLVHDEHKPTPDTKPNSIYDNFDEANHNRDGHTGNDDRYFPDMIDYMDKLIGNVVKKLEETGLRERTLIVVIGDNGTKEAFGHVLPDGTVYPGRKGGNADNGIHVPLIVNYPGVVPGGDDGNARPYDGLTYVTDIYPTIADAAGVEIPNRADLDGISFWDQAMGAQGEPRQTIHSWFIGNYNYKETDKVVRFAFDKNFKRYAPSVNFPEGRFFDLRTDLLEQQGDKTYAYRWGIVRRSGLDPAKLDDEQMQAYQRLGAVLEANEIVPVESISLTAETESLAPGTTARLDARVLPERAKRNGVIYRSSDPSVLEVDKFGNVLAIKPGSATVSVYSWDDAEPMSSNGAAEYKTSGVQAEKRITVLAP